VKDDIAEDSELYRSAVGALEEVAAAARSIRILADLLEQHPEVLLKGKGTPGAR
jgi:paraquat-inducible protein B